MRNNGHEKSGVPISPGESSKRRLMRALFNFQYITSLSAAIKVLIFLVFQKYRYLTSAFERPDFRRMMKDIELGKVNCVVTKDLSRLGVNTS